jgi:putative addiction module killer protein
MAMMNMQYKIELYETLNGKIPYAQWLESLDDYNANKISIRLERLQVGNFSNCDPVGDGVHEIKINFGPGYRIYFITIDIYKILVLNAGTKGTQAKDIKKAKEYLKDYKMREQYGIN